jgi:hypothetical protein
MVAELRIFLVMFRMYFVKICIEGALQLQTS